MGEAMTEPRDPRVTPAVGDLLRKDGVRREILELGDGSDIEEWRKWAKDAEVLKRGE
jgi:hypothetical protein